VSPTPSAGSISVTDFRDVEVAVISAGTLSNWVPAFEPAQEWITPDTDVDDGGAYVADINWMLVRTPKSVVLIDPCSFLPGEVIGRATLAAGIDLDSALVELGVRPTDVTHVVVSHFHLDHVGGLVARGAYEPRFPNAVHVVPARDWQAFIVDDPTRAPALLAQLGPVEQAGLLHMVDGDEVIAPGITVLDTPGESPGHLSVRIETPQGSVFYLADLFHFPVEFEHIDWIGVHDRPLEQMVASRRRILAEAEAAAGLVYTHSRFPGWGWIEPGPSGGWTWRFRQPAAGV
jgi:glyoxylase-like metal-dependent hydrolase (beta-lactamase superfamily II)